MSKLARDIQNEYPHLEKSVTLTGEDIASLRRGFRLNDHYRNRLTSLITALLEEEIARDDAMWDGLAQRLGFTDRSALNGGGGHMSVDWIAGVLELRYPKAPSTAP